ncbi:MAG TPA: lactate utilization protein C [Actinotalea sp.]|nr:lactate utilization protein C [Actinotalea sp.]
MSAREAVLRRVRVALAASGTTSDDVPRTYRHEGSAASGSPDAVALLADRLVDYRATVVRCAPDAVAGVVADQLADAGSVVVPPGLPEGWAAALAATGVLVRVDDRDAPLTHAALDATGAVLTACRVAIAETGTIVLDAGPDQGRRALTLLPDRHVCVVRADQVVGSVPQAVALLAEHPERPLTWISGPSATSDIELVRVEGVHGPRDLRVVLVG